MRTATILCILVAVSALVATGGLPAAEVVTITPEWLAGAGRDPAAAPPVGKEADWILGDHVLRNDRITAVIADPVPSRHANMTVRNAGGCVIDLTLAAAPNDQLSCWYPGDGTVTYRFVGATAAGAAAAGEDAAGEGAAGDGASRPLALSGPRVTFRVASPAKAGMARLDVTYALADGDDFLTVTTRFTNPHDAPLTVEPRDAVRADKTFTSGLDVTANCVWWDDEWFGQAYGMVPVGRTVADTAAAPQSRQPKDPVRSFADGKAGVELPPGGSCEYVRQIFPAPSLLEARAVALRLSAQPGVPAAVLVADAAGPVPRALVEIFAGDHRHGAGWTGADGRLVTSLPRGTAPWRIVASTVGRGRTEATLDPAGTRTDDLRIELPLPGVVVAAIVDAAGGPTPCKVQFRRRAAAEEKAVDPDFGPDSGDTGVKNLVYSHDGRFRRELPPGDYDVVVSLGPEHDAVMLPLSVARGRETPLAATLRRVVDTTGWVSGDFHSHSTPSGDNTTSQLGRVQNLLCEHIEFAPCTEHARIDSYSPLLERLGATDRMATCSGMELTGSLLPVNHQNAFPLVERRRTQDGGGPAVDNDDPVAQVARLALWDDAAEKLVQMNHPDLVQVLGDRDTDGTPDAGFEAMLGWVDVVEIHPPHEIFQFPTRRDDPRKPVSRIFVWLQMLNLGYRVPGVVNTDAHYAFHGSGWLRNYIRSPTDDPARIATADIVRACEAGRVMMTNGPFLEASLLAEDDDDEHVAGPGDQVVDEDGRVTLAVRVQCANWLDVDRVQVFVNGRPDPTLAATRRDRPAAFSRDVVRFRHEFTLALDRDAHVVVAAIGEGATLGVVMGPEHAADRPVAVTNPIFVDVGGDGFTPNEDLLDLPIPHQPAATHRRHVHGHAHPHRHAAPDAR